MRKFGYIAMVTLTTMCFVRSSNAQDPVYAPLSLFITGEGAIVPFNNGQMLEVGQNYTMEGVPSLGFAFSSWQLVDIATFTEIFYIGDTPVYHTSTLLSPEPASGEDPVLDFTMQPVTVILDTPARTVTSSVGWQANFVPAPEPLPLALIASGLMATVLVMLARFRRGRDLPL